MESTINASLGGFSFQFDAEAYSHLKQYLSQLEKTLGRSADGKEIYNSVEERLAELLGSRVAEEKPLTLEDVQWATEQMGAPSDFAEEGEEAEEPTVSTPYRRRRLFRDPDGAIFGGVCSGIGLRYGIPVWAVRLLFALAVFYYGVGLVVYLILALALPKAITPPEKLEMRGEPIDFEHIQDHVKRQYEQAKEAVRPENIGRNSREAASGFFTATGSILGTVLLGLLKAILIVAGLILLIGSVLGLMTMTIVLVTCLNTDSATWISFWNLASWNVTMPVYWFSTGWLMQVLVYLVVAIPLVFLFLLGLHFVVRTSVRKRLVVGLLCFWGLVIVLLSGYSIARWMSVRAEAQHVIAKVNIPLSPADTLRVVGDTEFSYENLDEKKGEYLRIFSEGSNAALLGNVDVQIRESKDAQWRYSVVVKARGKTTLEAMKDAKTVSYTPQLIGPELHIPSTLFAEGHMEKVERIVVKLYVPEGGTIYVENSLLSHVRSAYSKRRRGKLFWDFEEYCRMQDGVLQEPEDATYNPEEREGVYSEEEDVTRDSSSSEDCCETEVERYEVNGRTVTITRYKDGSLTSEDSAKILSDLRELESDLKRLSRWVGIQDTSWRINWKFGNK